MSSCVLFRDVSFITMSHLVMPPQASWELNFISRIAEARSLVLAHDSFTTSTVVS
jgi:hypothetical protein